MSGKLKKPLGVIFKVGLAVGLVTWMISKGLLDVGAIAEALTVQTIVICLALVFCNIFLNNLRWTMLLNSQNLHLSIFKTLPLTLIGLFFNFAMPGGVGGDVVKGYYLIQGHPDRKLVAGTSVIMDRVLGINTMILMALLALISNLGFVRQHSELIQVFFVLLALFVVICTFFAVAFSKRMRTWISEHRLLSQNKLGYFLKRVLNVIGSYRHNKPLIAKAIVISLLSQGCAILFFIYLGQVMSPGVMAWYNMFWLVPIGMILMALPISPAGIGVGQAVFLVLFNWVLGEKTSLGPNLITGYQLGLLSVGLVGIYFYVTYKKPEKLQ